MHPYAISRHSTPYLKEAEYNDYDHPWSPWPLRLLLRLDWLWFAQDKLSETSYKEERARHNRGRCVDETPRESIVDPRNFVRIV